MGAAWERHAMCVNRPFTLIVVMICANRDIGQVSEDRTNAFSRNKISC